MSVKSVWALDCGNKFDVYDDGAFKSDKLSSRKIWRLKDRKDESREILLV